MNYRIRYFVHFTTITIAFLFFAFVFSVFITYIKGGDMQNALLTPNDTYYAVGLLVLVFFFSAAMSFVYVPMVAEPIEILLPYTNFNEKNLLLDKINITIDECSVKNLNRRLKIVEDTNTVIHLPRNFYLKWLTNPVIVKTRDDCVSISAPKSYAESLKKGLV